ncbi:ABC transporter substrate-binding protein [Actinoplanes sp. NEAU-A12]|uniref:ABC transporter substrate-binding protein n=1 Tax=Actinoplanes sandaracinus TaxID=3045177 RepID=A0ABT6WM39_9ACTN|nr:ABC transporter substrate-binding protein [Actinoplanes sandaracinus]MDI6100782.1 ABC transporter substrate-binding protein [Actinoplanes sandaracinus]
MSLPGRLTRGAATGAALTLLLVAAGCTNPTGGGDPGTNSSAAQQVQATSGTTRCTPERYNGGVPKLDLKNITVGFAQSEKEANPFRITETQSIKEEAAKRGVKLITTNAQSDLNKEIADIQGMIAQGAQALIISPLNSEGLDPALKAAQDAKVPVMTIDRLLTTKTPCKDYLGWIGSDFVVQGQRAADAMIKATGDQGEVAILLGASGVNVTVDRTKGFKDQLAARNSPLKVVAEQTGDFTREKGQKVTEQLISANPGITAIYAENDEMALGAVAALKGADKKPGDIKIITIDGTKGAVQGILDGWIAGVIESNPRFGPLAFQALDDFYSGKGVVEKAIISDKEYTKDNARSELANAY